MLELISCAPPIFFARLEDRKSTAMFGPSSAILRHSIEYPQHQPSSPLTTNTAGASAAHSEFLNKESHQRQELKQNKSDRKQTLGGQRGDVAKCRFKPMERP